MNWCRSSKWIVKWSIIEIAHYMMLDITGIHTWIVLDEQWALS